MNQYFFKSFAATYNCGAYGTGSFDEGTACNPTTTNPTNPGTTTSPSGGLVNTGANFYVPLAGGIVLIVIALAVVIVSLKKRSKKA